MSAFVIIANGPFLVREIIEEVIQNKIIIALDGAANKLVRLGIKPDVVIGDFDSIQLEEVIDQDVTIIAVIDQDKTDLIKAIEYCDQNAAEHIALACATGGRADHDIGVMHALQTEYRKQRPIVLHTEQQTLCWVQDDMVCFRGQPGDHCGMIASHGCQFSSAGLIYECNQQTLSIGNQLSQVEAQFFVKGGALCIMPPLLAAQRSFMFKSEVERLALKLRDARCYA
jgi:thiamine pyrophosphokinase